MPDPTGNDSLLPGGGGDAAPPAVVTAARTLWRVKGGLHLLALVCVIVGLAGQWAELTVTAPGATTTAAVYLYYSTSCVNGGGCSTTSAYADQEQVLQSGQLVASGLLVGALLSILRFALRTAACASRVTASAAKPTSALRVARSLAWRALLGDAFATSFTVAAVAVFAQRATAWEGEYVTSRVPAGIPVTLVWSYALYAAAVGAAVLACGGAVTVTALVRWLV